MDAMISMTAAYSALAMPIRLAAQDQEEQNKKQPHYTVTDLGTSPGGTFSQATFVHLRDQVGCRHVNRYPQHDRNCEAGKESW